MIGDLIDRSCLISIKTFKTNIYERNVIEQNHWTQDKKCVIQMNIRKCSKN